MRILRFELRAFGPFTKQSLDWSKGDRGLHVIYGQNEAGKSSALRALRQLLFGIDSQTPDNFLHSYAKLRLGAHLRNDDGREFAFVRRKTPIKTPLFDAEDKVMLDAGTLTPFLGGVDESVFRTMFGIDHDELRKGGSEILAGRGDLGEMLFAAGSGIADLRKVQQRLRDEIETLFKPAGKNQKIAVTLSALSSMRDLIKKASLPSETFLQKERELSQARSMRDKLDSEFKSQSQQHKRLENIATAFAFVQQRQTLLNELIHHSDAPSLDDTFSMRRSDAQIALAEARTRVQQSEKNIAALDERLKQLHVPTAVLDQATSIEELNERIGAFQMYEKDFPERNTQRKTVEHDAKEILRSLGRPGDLSEAETLRLRADEPLHIQELSRTFQKLTAKLEKVNEDLEAAEHSLTQAQQELANRKSLPDVALLRQLVPSIEKQDLPPRLQSIRDEYRRLNGQAEAKLKLLPFWNGTLSDLADLPAPAVETVDRFESEFVAAEDQRKDAQRQLDEFSERHDEIQSERQELELKHDLPTLENLTAARKHRDVLWRKLYEAWQKREPLAENQTNEFSESVQEADEIADRLRREATRVAQMAHCTAELNRLEQRIGELKKQKSKANAQYSAVEKHWTKAWAGLIANPLSPREMRAWLHQRSDLLNLAEQCRTLKSQGEKLRDDVSDSETQLRDALRQAGETTRENASLEILLGHSRKTLEQWDREHQARETADRDLVRLQREYQQEQSRKQQLEEALAKWRTQWAPAMAKLHLGPDASPVAAQQFVDAIHNLFAKLHEADGFRRRLDGMQRDMDQFREDTLSLAKRLLGEATEVKPDRLAQDLAARLKDARKIQQQFEALSQQRKQEEAAHQTAQSELAKTQSTLEAMCKQAEVASVEELPAAERKAEKRRSLEQQLYDLEKNLLPLQGGQSLDKFATEVIGHDPVQLETDLQKCEQSLVELKQKLANEQDRVVELQLRFEDMDGRADAAEAENEAQQLAAELRNDAEQFITLSLAAEVLKKGIIRFRDKHHGELVDRASELFAALTCNSFSKLIADYDEKGEPILMGVRHNGDDKVDVSGMSSGTCDQLYLALRIAGLEAYCQRHEPLPLVLDDVLLNFDDDRSAAALKALGELSNKTQVLFFTHHRHLIDMAKINLPDEKLFVHELACRANG